MNDDHRLQIVEDRAGKRGSFGNVQAAWLIEKGIITRSGYESTGPLTGIDYWRVVGDRTVEDVSNLVLAQPDLSECDFCSAIPAGWRIPVRVFEVRMVPGPFKRPIYACDDCVTMYRAGDRHGLIERRIEAAVDQALAHGGAMAASVGAIPKKQIDEQLVPPVREFVEAVFSNQQGDVVEAVT